MNGREVREAACPGSDGSAIGLGREAQEERKTPNAQLPTPKRNAREGLRWELGIGSWELITLLRQLLPGFLKLLLDRRLLDALTVAGKRLGPRGNRLRQRAATGVHVAKVVLNL